MNGQRAGVGIRDAQRYHVVELGRVGALEEVMAEAADPSRHPIQVAEADGGVAGAVQPEPAGREQAVPLLVVRHRLAVDPHPQALALRKDFQLVLQDPFSSLPPRTAIGAMLEEPLRVHGVRNARERRERVLAVMNEVGLPAALYDDLPLGQTVRALSGRGAQERHGELGHLSRRPADADAPRLERLRLRAGGPPGARDDLRRETRRHRMIALDGALRRERRFAVNQQRL